MATLNSEEQDLLGSYEAALDELLDKTKGVAKGIGYSDVLLGELRRLTAIKSNMKFGGKGSVYDESGLDSAVELLLSEKRETKSEFKKNYAKFLRHAASKKGLDPKWAKATRSYASSLTKKGK